MSFKVLVNSVEKIQDFVTITNSTDYDVDLLSGRSTYLDGKSFLGILSCNINEPMTVIVNCDDDSENARLRGQLDRYIV